MGQVHTKIDKEGAFLRSIMKDTDYEGLDLM